MLWSLVIDNFHRLRYPRLRKTKTKDGGLSACKMLFVIIWALEIYDLLPNRHPWVFQLLVALKNATLNRWSKQVKIDVHFCKIRAISLTLWLGYPNCMIEGCWRYIEINSKLGTPFEVTKIHNRFYGSFQLNHYWKHHLLNSISH